MRSLAFLCVLQSLATGAYIAVCADAGALSSTWPLAAFLVLLDASFVYYVLSRSDKLAR
ncbi:MAG TPA: hypothetical protein VE986_03175 [Hyphomicrobiales bacterium]|nr:hypothetical protein [Hyphomicrobiales bacterium]